MPDGVRGLRRFCRKDGTLLAANARAALDHRVNTETRHGITIAVDEQARASPGRPLLSGRSVAIVFFQSGQKRTFLPLPVELHDSSSVNVPFQSSIVTLIASLARAPEL